MFSEFWFPDSELSWFQTVMFKNEEIDAELPKIQLENRNSKFLTVYLIMNKYYQFQKVTKLAHGLLYKS